MRRTMSMIVVTTAGLLGVTACGGSENPTLTTQSFDSAMDLKAAVVDRGVVCNADTVAQGKGYKESLKCGDNVWLTVFESAADKEARIEAYDEQGSSYVQGQNWVIVAPEETLQKVTG